MSAQPYRTLDDIRLIITHEIPESTVLEYKRSIALTNRAALCKTVTAFANSMGGHFVLGIETDNGKPLRLDGGFVGPSKRDWVYKIINANTFPPVETLEVLELPDTQGNYYVIHVGQSSRAPHQSDDHRYYKRRGSHSEPMEHYEIEDIRNRPKQPVSPLRIGLYLDEIIAVLVIENTHPTDAIRNIRCEVRGNFPLPEERLSSLKARGIRELHPHSDRRFILDSVPTILNKNKEAEIEFDVTYLFHETRLSATEVFYFADLNNTIVVRSPVEKAVGKIGEKIDKLNNQLEKLHQDMEKLTKLTDGSGLRLSHRTIRALQNRDQLVDPRECDWQGYKIILDISDDEALRLQNIFGYVRRGDELREQYEALPSELRGKFEASFKVEFD